MKILILANNGNGLYKFRKELIEKLIALKNEVFISTPFGNRVEDLKNVGCNYIETEVDRRGTNLIKDLKLIFKYRKIIKQIKPNIVLTYTIKPNIYGGIICRKKKIPYIVNITGLGTGLENKGVLQKILIQMYKFALKKVNCVFCQNEEICKFLTDNKISNKIKLIPGSGVNLENFNLEDYPDTDMQTFLFIGRIMKEKGIEEYLEAAKIIKEKYENVKFKIIGEFEEDYKEEIDKFEREGIVEYCGVTSNIKEYIKNSNCTILPSYHEGTANVLLESAAMGRPLIASNIPGCKEIIDDEITGYVFELKNVNDLVEKIENFLKLPYEEKKQMGLKGRKKVEKEFDRNIVINKYKEEIEKIEKGEIKDE